MNHWPVSVISLSVRPLKLAGSALSAGSQASAWAARRSLLVLVLQAHRDLTTATTGSADAGPPAYGAILWFRTSIRRMIDLSTATRFCHSG